MVQQIDLIRHGQSTFNVHNDATGEDPLHFDARLSELGHAQVAAARAKLNGHAYELIITSPLTRALQTAVGIFGDIAPILVSPHVREWANYSCDVGRPSGELAQEFPSLDFTELPERWWHVAGRKNTYGIVCEPEVSLLRRVAAFSHLVGSRPERRIAVVGHGDFFFRLVGRQLANCELARWR